MAHPFPVGTKVETNEEYFEKFGRKVIGTSVTPPDHRTPKEITIVKWDHQEGNIIPEHTGKSVLMMSNDLKGM